MMQWAIFWTEDQWGRSMEPPQRSACFINKDINKVYQHLQYNSYKGYVDDYNNIDGVKIF